MGKNGANLDDRPERGRILSASKLGLLDKIVVIPVLVTFGPPRINVAPEPFRNIYRATRKSRPVVPLFQNSGRADNLPTAPEITKPAGSQPLNEVQGGCPLNHRTNRENDAYLSALLTLPSIGPRAPFARIHHESRKWLPPLALDGGELNPEAGATAHQSRHNGEKVAPGRQRNQPYAGPLQSR